MQVCKDQKSGRCFLLIEETSRGATLVVNPEGEIKLLETARMKGIPALGLKAAVAAELLTEIQLRVYNRHGKSIERMIA